MEKAAAEKRGVKRARAGSAASADMPASSYGNKQAAKPGVGQKAHTRSIDGSIAAGHQPRAAKSGKWLRKSSGLFAASGLELVGRIRAGVPATLVVDMVEDMAISKESLYKTLDLPRSSIERKIRDKSLLSADESARIIGLGQLVAQVEAMVERSGNPEGFSASKWVAGWLQQPIPALDGATPASLMDTLPGQQLVSQLLAQAESAAYA